MKFGYRSKLTILIFSLVFVALAAVTGFFLRLYRNERLASVYETELASTNRVSGSLENLIFVAQLVDPGKVSESKDLVWLVSDPCGTPEISIARQFAKPLMDLGVTPEAWLRSAEVRTVCAELGDKLATHPIFISGGPKLYVPTLLVLARGPKLNRLSLLSLDGLGATDGAHAILVSDKDGKVIWSDAANDGLERLMTTTGLTEADIVNLSTSQGGSGSSGITHTGKDGIVAYAGFLDGMNVLSVNSERALLESLDFVLKQALFLVGGFLFSCFFIGRIFANRLTRPLQELSLAALAIGSGRFNTRVKITETDEISIIKRSFNSMAEKIVGLIAETKNQAMIESEIVLAQQVQKMLFPPPLVRLPNLDLYSFVQMADKCGGDWWGYLTIPVTGKLPLTLVLIGDVTGHGVSSALVTAATQGALAMLSGWIEQDAEVGQDPRNILRLFNRAVYQSSRGALSMSFFAVVLDSNSDQLFAANAGHNWPYILSSEGKIKPFGQDGLLLGREPEVEYPTILEASWEKNSQLFLYTDGLIDCYKGDENLFERRHLIRILKKGGKLKGGKLLEALLEERSEAIKGLKPQDDVTVVICTRH